MTFTDLLFRVYAADECGPDGYPLEWHRSVKHLVREEAGHRCVRCGHPYPPDIAKTCPRGEWTPCDDGCGHGGNIRIVDPNGIALDAVVDGATVFAHWRILTVHHLIGDKFDLRWWNLAALCQRCHLQVQGKVKMHQTYPFEHSEWFKPYAAGYYAFTYLGEELTRDQAVARMDELLALERVS